MAEKARVAVLISGRGSNMAALLYAAKAADCPYEIVLVASNNPEAAGLTLAAAEGIATFAHSHVGMERAEFDALIDAELRRAGADYVALAGYMRKLSPAFVAQWEGRLLNIHPSLLPKYKGLHTHEQAIAAGDSYAGCSVHIVTAELDDGPVLGQTPVIIMPGDTAETLADRVRYAEHQLYPRILSAYVSRERNPAWIREQIALRALALPETHEKSSHGSPGWRVGSEKTGKFFAVFFNRHHGEDVIGLLVKTPSMDELLALCEDQPDVYFKPAYYGPAGWIGIRLDRNDVDWDHIGEWLERSWRINAPARLTRMMDAADAF